MSKVAMKDVRDLVSKWEQKALKDNTERYDNLKNIAVQAFLDSGTPLATTVTKLSICFEGLKEQEQKFKDITGSDLNIIFSSQTLSDILFNADYRYVREAFPFLAKNASEREQARHNIKSEYAKLNERITLCKSGDKAKKMLEEMGLDVSSLRSGGELVALQDSPLDLALMGLKKS